MGRPTKTMVILVGSVDYMIWTTEKVFDESIDGSIYIPLGQVEKFTKYKNELIKRGYVITKDETTEEQDDIK